MLLLANINHQKRITHFIPHTEDIYIALRQYNTTQFTPNTHSPHTEETYIALRQQQNTGNSQHPRFSNAVFT